LLLTDRTGPEEGILGASEFRVRVVRNGPPVLGAVIREQFLLPRVLAASGCDLAHFPCNTGPLRYRGRYVVTIHDLNTIVAPDPILDRYSPEQYRHYFMGMYTAATIRRLAQRAAAIITDSRHSCKEIVEILGVSEEKVFVAHLAPSSVYRPLSVANLMEKRIELEQRYGISQPYVLAIGGRPSKNVAGVLRGFHMLNSDLRSTHMLVIVLASDANVGYLKHHIRSLDLDGKVLILVGRSTQELLCLYSCAELVAFPSFREGFGLPVVEAMATATPVVTSTIAPLPETAEGAALLVDPSDDRAISAGMQRVLNDQELRAGLRRAGLKRVSRLSWRKTAEETMRVYEYALRSPR
jgi:glycosyltransferase involved in cell wall biosynthesis